jgi:anionic cell wall polymer biosynthesis LytR-Cps2A-Psr (LCP) family protein
MNYTDEAGGLYINLKKGEQVLDGDKSEQFLRWRKNNDGSGDGLGDIGRVQRQQMFIKATIKQLMKPSNILKINKIEELVSEKVVTNVPPSLMVGWFKDFAIGFDFDQNFEMVTVPGDYSDNGIYWEVSDEDYSELTNIIQNHLMPGIENNINVKVYNSTGNDDIVQKAIDKLNKYPFVNVTFAGEYDKELPLTEVLSYTDNNIAKYIASIVNAQNNVYVGNNEEEADLVIIIGNDLDI